ncbi:MAG: polysaccharide deacetylase family protein [Ferruginibacter sp.]
MLYLVKTPWWLRQFYSNCIWQMSVKEKIIYLTFDDGPHPYATPFVLETLKAYNAKATFFCIGKNVVQEPALYNDIITEGHAVGNHTFNHFNGWKTENSIYLNNICEAAKVINSPLFRPPYGKITQQQLKLIALSDYPLKTIMWTILSGDFDLSLRRERCLEHVLTKTGEGSIVVFHDSEKAYENMAFTLPRVLEYFSERGYRFETISF